MRKATKTDSLKQLISLGIQTVIDVGVAKCTESLMKVFPKAHHILIESDGKWTSTYKDTYRLIKHSVLIRTANSTNNRVDSIFCDNKPILIKIDVDGAELEVLEGCSNLFKDTAVIVIEATIQNFPRIVFVLSLYNFILFDIVDLCYCSNQLHQCDLIFVNDHLIDKVTIPFDITKYQS